MGLYLHLLMVKIILTFFDDLFPSLTALFIGYSSPSTETLHSIYLPIVKQHFKNSALAFLPQIVRSADMIVQLTLTVHQKVAHTFLPTAAKFHYIFNMKELTNLFQVVINFLQSLVSLKSLPFEQVRDERGGESPPPT